jgi:hypothetical protein
MALELPMNQSIKLIHMKTLLFSLTILLSAFTNTFFAQQLPNKPRTSDVRSMNQNNLMKVEIGMSKSKVIESMGGIQTIQTYYTDPVYFISRKNAKGLTINNPYSRDLKSDSAGNNIEILWYYTDLKGTDDAIRKDELTPIILENNALVGLGWGFFEDYSKRKELNININD